MDFLKKFWPQPFSLKQKEVKPFVILIIIYAVADIILGTVSGLLSAIPILGLIFSIVGSLIGLYCTAGIVFSILKFAGVFKD